jgi:hypothetical protein
VLLASWGSVAGGVPGVAYVCLGALKGALLFGGGRVVPHVFVLGVLLNRDSPGSCVKCGQPAIYLADSPNATSPSD